MAEPYDTINAIGSGPVGWWRFSDASGGITNEGSDATGDAVELDIGGLFNGTYQYEANPLGDGFGLLFGGQGGFDADLTTIIAAARGSMFVMYRPVGTPVNSDWMFGAYEGFDTDYCRLAVAPSNGFPKYHIQDSAAEDESWHFPESQLDDEVHSLAVTPPATTGGTPAFYVDGSPKSFTFSGDDSVPNNHWMDSFTETFTFGHRGNPIQLPMDNMVLYEALVFDESTPLTDQEILTVHEALGGFVNPFSTKTTRRTNRRLFADLT